MKHLHLLIPDLFLPRDIAAEVCAGVQSPALEALLARARQDASPATNLEDWLCAAFGAEAVAPVRAAADGLEARYWLCADPVNLQQQQAQIWLLPDVQPSREEADALCASLNGHFAEHGLRFFAPHPRRWYVQTEYEPHMTTTALGQAAWRDAKFLQPQGTDALPWQAIVVEAQMLLHDHAVNRARVARGELAINSLWLWGGGHAKRLNKAFDTAGGDSELGAAFAQAAGITQIETLRGMLEEDFDSGLWVWEALSTAHQRDDYHVWREAMQRFEGECVLLLHALRAGRVQRITLEALQEEGSRRFELTRASAWKLWRAAKPLARYAV